MADAVHIPNEAEARAHFTLCAFAPSREIKRRLVSRKGAKARRSVRFVFASEARQPRSLFGQSGLPRRFAPRNDGRV